MPEASARRMKILSLIEQKRIRTQNELQALLAEEGFQATQTTVSRDIASLGLGKVAGVYSASGGAAKLPGLAGKVEGKVTGVYQAGPYMVVLKTPIGEASAVGFALDEACWPSIVGIVAGDDTLFIACNCKQDTSETLDRLSKLVPDTFKC